MSDNVKFNGNPIAIGGTFPTKGQDAKDFRLVTQELSDATLETYRGKRKILTIFPSIDTTVCAASVRQFNKLSSNLTNTVVLCISADLPFAQKRFCGAEGLENVHTLSTFRSPTFSQDYGVAIEEGPLAGLTARSIVVIDENDKVIYSQLVDEITTEPDYDSAIAALK